MLALFGAALTLLLEGNSKENTGELGSLRGGSRWEENDQEKPRKALVFYNGNLCSLLLRHCKLTVSLSSLLPFSSSVLPKSAVSSSEARGNLFKSSSLSPV